MSKYSFMDSPHKRWKSSTTGINVDNVRRMGDDLISREALKEVINDLFRTGEYDCNSVSKAIDNAPAVSYPFEEFRTMLCGTCQAYMRIGPERPTGEWITICTLPVIRKCSLCGVEYSSDAILYGNFCPNCGADMERKQNGN